MRRKNSFASFNSATKAAEGAEGVAEGFRFLKLRRHKSHLASKMSANPSTFHADTKYGPHAKRASSSAATSVSISRITASTYPKSTHTRCFHFPANTKINAPPHTPAPNHMTRLQAPILAHPPNLTHQSIVEARSDFIYKIYG